MGRQRIGPLLIGAMLLAHPVAAQFYDLDGAYRCVTAPSDDCKEELRDRPAPAAAAPRKVPQPTLDEVIAHVRLNQLTPADVRLLEARATQKDAHAIEVLAWCRLNGIGMAADPLAAYWLYGDAAALGVATAGSNQAAIYTTRLSPEERQQVALRENGQTSRR